ncbi:hypothetical protein G6F46_001668 [Rhizopus delemar]|uniref:BAR domain-containing protein n=2 Tax=Rhizopus TaxID=4842 RepID=A0A9P7CMJ0_9FUNG|nr:hypothetical protein G6F43_011097 [Rhizopus delemar]KAG1550926.1 hypothetical protein G6F51_002161 [Rhizopus arrhizus]KAG1449911.1 hypothetical protein G6F55_009948 [Rhizopus delemar]KAG1505483.1 hypothetical protein G6F54_000274 [Rhizopus delemar]KAG1516807.1 hypothetical protein G6F53_001870 [Rhizopus delemar]
MVSNKQVLFTKIPTGFPEPGEHMQIKETTLDLDAPLQKGEFILKQLVFSVDPYMRGRMRDASIESYAPAFGLNEPMTGDTMGVVLRSNHPDYKVDDLVYGRTARGAFEEYSRVTAEEAKKSYVVRNDAKQNGLPLRHYVGVLGMPGMTAYYGLHEIGKPKRGETLYVSAASGAVGQLVGQFGKALGLYVVGSAGSDEKVDYLKSIGFDAAFNYKQGSIDHNLAKHCPKGIDIYYENVGGEMLDAVLAHANNYSRVVVCGMISQYNREKPEPLFNVINVLVKRMTVQGFIIMDHPDFEEKFLKDVTALLLDGRITYREDIAKGIEKTPEALCNVLRGVNFGKQVVEIAELSGIKKNLNRAGTTIKQKTGGADKTFDNEYEEELERFKTLEKKSNKLSKHAKQYMDSTRAIIASQTRLLQIIEKIYGDNAFSNPVFTEYKKALEAIERESKDNLDPAYQKTVIEPLARYVSYFPEVNEAIKRRNKKLLDYDQSRSKVRKLIDKPSEDPSRLPRAEQEANMARELYENLNTILVNDLPKLIDLRVPYLDPVFEALVKTELRFSQSGYEYLEGMRGALPVSMEGGDRRVDEVLQQMRELTICGNF